MRDSKKGKEVALASYKHLRTTNCMESTMSLIGQRTDKVYYWSCSNQKERGLPTAPLDIEPRLSRIRGWAFPLHSCYPIF